MENFTMESNKNNQEKESEFLSLDFFKKAVKRFTLASAIFLASFGASEAQQKQGKWECPSHKIDLNMEKTTDLEKKTHEIDSLSDVLLEKAKEHNLLQIEKSAPETHWEVDSTENLYYKSKNSTEGIVLYEEIQKKNNTTPRVAKNDYSVHYKFICANKKLFTLAEENFAVGNYGNPDSLKENTGFKGNKFVNYMPGDGTKTGRKILTSFNGFTTEELFKSLDDVTQKLKEEIKLVEGM